jgi:hypothetical protein
VVQLYPWALGSLSVASYNSQGYGGARCIAKLWESYGLFITKQILWFISILQNVKTHVEGEKLFYHQFCVHAI